MPRSNLSAEVLATSFVERAQEWSEHLNRSQQDLLQLVEGFLDQPLTPTALCEFERALQKLLQRFGRTTLEGSLQQPEPEALPAQVCRAGEY